MKTRTVVFAFVVVASLVLARAQTEQPAWVARSNQNAQVLLTIQARYGPEGAARVGIAGLDEQITQFPSDQRTKVKVDVAAAIAELKRRRTLEHDPLVAQDLDILITAAQRQIDSQALSERLDLPYVNVSSIVFNGIRALLDDQVPEGRRKTALVRLRKYAGIEPGYQPLTEQAKARSREWRQPGQTGPSKVEVETDLARGDFFVNGIGELFARYNIEGYEAPFATLKQQLADYQEWVRREVLPLARTDFRLPPEKYRFSLLQYGVDVPAADLAKIAHASFEQ